ncbi:phosphotransferase family protein, partial [Candidatus Latescibacterota bacterium]
DHHSPLHELLFTRLVTHHAGTVPVPEIHIVDLSGKIIQWPFLINTWLTDEPIKKHVLDGHFDVSEKVFGSLGNIIGRIHSIDVVMSGFGTVRIDSLPNFLTTEEIPESLHGASETFEERYSIPASQAADYLFSQSVLTRNDLDTIEMILSENIPDDDDIVFQHGDMSMGNFLTDGHDITGVLDGSGVIGHRFEELAGVFMFLHALAFYFPHFLPDRAFDSFMRGYTDISNIEILNGSLNVFLVKNVVNHMAVLVKKGTKTHISKFTSLLKKHLKR